MKSISLLYSCLLLALLIPVTKSQSDSAFFLCNETYGNYTQGSAFQSNLNVLLASLASNTLLNDFYNTSSGNGQNRVNGLIQCRGDISAEDCRMCKTASVRQILKLCPYYKEAQVSYENCWLCYSGDALFWEAYSFYFDEQEEPKTDAFNRRVRKFMNSIASKAASSSSKLATGNSSGIYGLVQCTRNSSRYTCLGCLQKMFNYLSDWPTFGAKYYRALSTVCFVRYELYPFFSESSASPPAQPRIGIYPVPTSETHDKKNNVRKIILATVLPIAVILISISAICAILARRKSLQKKDGGEEYWMKGTESFIFDLSSIRTATENFSDSCKLGEGGFGSVYKGELPDGREVAVKRLSLKSTQGLEQLKTEVVLVAKLMHRNLVRLFGFCLEEEEKLLVYEYLPNGSLDKILFDQSRHELLDWDKRYKIIVGIVRGLLYLHEDSQLRIVHRDLKASNILLDENMNAKISDFGLARLFADQENSRAEENTNRIAGTYGYMAPEYVINGQFSSKSDVFSFGVLALEIVAGRKNSSFHGSANLLSYAWQRWSKGTPSDIVDPTINIQRLPKEVLKCIQVALLCVQEDAYERPTMSQVLLLLNTHGVTCPVPSRPAYFVNRVITDSEVSGSSHSYFVSDQSPNKTSINSANEVTVSDIYPR